MVRYFLKVGEGWASALYCPNEAGAPPDPDGFVAPPLLLSVASGTGAGSSGVDGLDVSGIDFSLASPPSPGDVITVKVGASPPVSFGLTGKTAISPMTIPADTAVVVAAPGLLRAHILSPVAPSP
tara:strand:- start:2114 stop:2488 length:375 start_codon:yes stop_codon:yes gene_type:complete